ncbi:MAG: hypothetical protein EPO22_13030 [Dehalococcoidia bacterium]|nr:MAG: hypothetical protein EPO22_13030 [Dehalococcoidia bacterium]
MAFGDSRTHAARLRAAAALGPGRRVQARIRARAEAFFGSGNVAWVRNFLLVRPAIAVAVAAAVMMLWTGLFVFESAWLYPSGSYTANHMTMRYDGTGYPDGLAGEEIPLAARIVAVADVYDALASKRPYKPAWPVEDAIAEVARLAGTHLDPDVVRAFVELYDRNILRDLNGAGPDADVAMPAPEAA